MKKKIRWSIIIEMVEFWIWVSVILLIWTSITRVLLNTDLLDYIENIFLDIWGLLGANFWSLFYTIMLWIVIIYVARWAVSWSSSNWWQTPNNKWN